MTVSTLTPSRVASANPRRHSYTIHDKGRKGLCLRVAPTGRKTFEINVTRKGTRHKETIGDAATMTLTEARVAFDRRIGEFAALDGIGPETLFETMAELTFSRKHRLWKPGTMAVNRGYLRHTILPYFEGRTIGSITRMDVEDWFASNRSKPGNANRAAPVLSGIMREAEDMGARPEDSNPVHGLRRYKRPRKERVLTPDEMARLGTTLEELEKRRPLDAAMIRLVALTGCRKGEIQNLEWRDYRDGHLHLRDSKTGPKTVYLSTHARAVLDGIKTSRPGPVFPALNGRGRAICITGVWSKLRKEVGLDDVRLHDFRHHYATTATRMGVNLTVVGTLLGHGSVDTTLGYAHLDDGMMREAVRTVGTAISASKGDEQ